MVKIVSVNVGRPAPLGRVRGEVVMSGIVKEPVATGVLALDRLNLAGDAQADLRVHGGLDKAVYTYASEHLPAWTSELGFPLGPGSFGENLLPHSDPVLVKRVLAVPALADEWRGMLEERLG